MKLDLRTVFIASFLCLFTLVAHGGTWTAPVLIETDNAGSAYEPQIAIDIYGNALAVWYQHDGARYNIVANRYTALRGWGWGVAGPIEGDNAGNAFYPQIAMEGNGNAHVVWSQFDGVNTNVISKRYIGGLGWSPAVPIEGVAGWAKNPQIAVNTNGYATAVWALEIPPPDAKSPGSQHIYSNRYTPGVGWSKSAVRISTGEDGTYAGSPQVAIDANGNATAVWIWAGSNVMVNRYTAATNSWGTNAVIATGNVQGPQVAVDANGNAMVVWVQYDGTYYSIMSMRWTPANSWGSAALIEFGNVGHARNPQIAFDSNGNAVAVWEQDGVAGSVNIHDVWANRYTAATNIWGTAVRIETGAFDASSPQIAVNYYGDAMAVWSQSDGVRNNILANRYTAAANSWGTATLIETNNTGSAVYAQVAIQANGDARVVWSQSDGVRYNIWSSNFLADCCLSVGP